MDQPRKQHPKPLAVILARPTTMTEQEIIKSISNIEGFGGMTVNERLFACGLMNEFDNALIDNKEKAKKILELLGVDKLSIEKIVV
jgi:hypothetical protein